MNAKTLLFAFLFSSSMLAAQEQTPAATAPKQETIFNNGKVRGGFGGPIFSWSHTNGKTGYGAGGGGGVVFDRVFVGFFGMGETFDNPLVNTQQLALGYGGLWLGYTYPSHKAVHLFTSVKLGGGGAGVTNYRDDWDFDDDWHDITFVAVPEAGVELNLARWMRLSGSVGYRYVGGFEGWSNYGKNDLNTAVYNLTLRFGWFGK